MEPVTYSWIGQCAAAPLVFLASAWTVGVLHSYKRRWASVDLFLLAIATQELLMALQVFVFSLLSLVRPTWDGACGALVWSLNATRALQLATVASLLADRALTCHWPYRYRFSVRRHQLRYHLAVLAAMAGLLGVAALIARPQHPTSFPDCATMPHMLHIRLALFLLAIYGALLLVAVISAVVVQTNRGCGDDNNKSSAHNRLSKLDSSNISVHNHHHQIHHHITNTNKTISSTASSNKSGPQVPPLSTSSLSSSSHCSPTLKTSASTASNSSTGLSAVGGGGGGGGGGTGGSGGAGMRAASSTADLLPVAPQQPTGSPTSPPISSGLPSFLRNVVSSPGGSEFRWTTCLTVATLCCLINHVPYLVLTVLGTFTPSSVPQWLSDQSVLWLNILEGALLPLLLLLTDPPFRRGASCGGGGTPQGTTGTRPLQRHFQDGAAPFRLYPKDEAKVFPLTNGSLFSSLLTLPVDGGPRGLGDAYPHHQQYYKKDGGVLGLRMGISQGGGLRGLDLRKLRGGRGEQPYGAPYYCRDTRGGSVGSLTTSSQHDPLYSDPTNKTISSMDSSMKEEHIYATLSETFGSMSSFSDGCINDDNRCPSVTTVANDDFEFHDPRISGCSGIDHHPMGRGNIGHNPIGRGNIDHHPMGKSFDHHHSMKGSNVDHHHMIGSSENHYHLLGSNDSRRNPCLRQQSYSGSSFSSANGLPSFGMRIRDDDTLELTSARNPNVTGRPPLDLPPQAFHSTDNRIPNPLSEGYNANIQVINAAERHSVDGSIKTDSDLVIEKNRQNMMNSGRFEPFPEPRKICYDNFLFESDTLEKKYYMEKYANDENQYSVKEQTRKHDMYDGTLSRKHRISSLSMNDLDRFDKEKEPDTEEKMMFLLPVKSESMLSLYRLYLAEDEQDSSASLHYSLELSKSENDLSVVNEEQENLGIGRSAEDIHRHTSHEIYRKRRRPQSSASKIRRQHKIQRAKGLQHKNKPQIQSHNQIPFTGPQKITGNAIYSPDRSLVSNVIDGSECGVQVAIMDNARRPNGIITIRDPSGLSVQELFSVLNRATASVSSSGRRKIQNSAGDDYKLQNTNRTETNETEENKTSGQTGLSIHEGQHKAILNAANVLTSIPVLDNTYQPFKTTSTPSSSNVQPEFRKIFVSEYL